MDSIKAPNNISSPIHPDVMVSVTFVHGKAFTQTLRLGNRLVTIAKTLQEWTGTRHGKRVHYQLVEDHDGVQYKLYFDLHDLSWSAEPFADLCQETS